MELYIDNNDQSKAVGKPLVSATLLKLTEEYRVDTEIEAKDLMEKMRSQAISKGYAISKCGYTYKCKKAKGEIIDEAWVVSVVKNYNTVWSV